MKTKKDMYESLNTRVYNTIELSTQKSAWSQGVRDYALELLQDDWVDIEENTNRNLLEKHLLNGANDWKQFSWGGCSLIYDADIAKRLSTPSELKITKDGQRNPNKNEQWLDTQARALYQAFNLICDVMEAQQKKAF